MADLPPHDDTMGPDLEPTTGAPRWVKVFGIIALVLVLLFVILQLTGLGGGAHGPGRHTSSGNPGGDISASSVTADLTPPEAGH